MGRAAGIDEREPGHGVGAAAARPIDLGRRDRCGKGGFLQPELGAAGDGEVIRPDSRGNARQHKPDVTTEPV